ncbi:MAG: HDIG domain-containing protein [Fuerstiella sp.]|nr:HDIG domain-containing protein [Fuerstiella sp.]
MTFFGTRRARQTRVFRPAHSRWERLLESLWDYRTIKQLLIGVAAVVVLLVSLQAWKSRFPYREGQFVRDGVLSRVDFSVENVLETRQARLNAEENADPVFVRHDNVIDDLTATFRGHLSAVANAGSSAELDPSVAQAFGVIRNESNFEQLHTLLRDTVSIGELLDQLALDFSQWLGEARVVGILTADDLDNWRYNLQTGQENLQIAQREQTRIEIVGPDDPHPSLSYAPLSSVKLDEQLRDTGTLGKAWTNYETLQPIRSWVETWISASLNGHLVYNEKLTNERRQQAAEREEPQYDFFPAESIIVPAGARVTREYMRLLVHEFEAYETLITSGQRILHILGAALLLVALVILMSMYLAGSQPELLNDPGQLLALIAICGAAVGTGKILSIWHAEVIPVMATVIIVAIVYSRGLALVTGFCLSLLVAFATLERLDQFACLMLLCVTVTIPLNRISSQATIIKVGFVAAAVGFLSVWGLNLLQANSLAGVWQNSAILWDSLRLACWSLVCCFVVHGSLTFIERAFGIVTDISLLGLTDVSHPLLQELARRAPGSYNHSLSVATIGEAAADAIGANGLLVRVGAYFHDIGKMLKPEYFIENMIEGQESQHDNLTPAMSALIIIGHVKDGSELAEQHNLPQQLIDFIEQHHGTTLVEYFYHEAAARADEDHRTDADESTFRYPGPKPQSRETGVMMLVDAVESASRTLSEPTPNRIQTLVREITLKRLLDGQFDECGLTMSELRIVQKSVVKTLLAVHHSRIKYPDQKTA